MGTGGSNARYSMQYKTSAFLPLARAANAKAYCSREPVQPHHTAKTRMKIVLIILACLLSHKVLPQQLPDLYNSDCIVHHNSEDSCYSTNEVICEHGMCSNPPITLLPIYIREEHSFPTTSLTISSGVPNATIVKLCREVALKLTSHDLKCLETCSTKSIGSGLVGFSVRCPQVHYDVFKGNWSLLRFSPKPSCMSSVRPYFVLIDTSGKLINNTVT